MKKSIFILLLLIAKFGVAQTLLFESKIYFEDAMGNRDTIEIGYDTSADSEYNFHLGEFDLKNAFDSEFEVRASHSLAWGNNFKECILSKRIIGACEKIIDSKNPGNECYAGEGIIFFIKAKYQPVKISWNQSDFENGVNDCQGSSFFTPDFLYHIVDPISWINWPDKRYSCASLDTTFEVNLDQSYIASNYSKEHTYSTIRTFLNGIQDTILGVELNFEIDEKFSPCQLISQTDNQNSDEYQYDKQELNEHSIYPNPATDYILIDNRQINPLNAIWIYDQNGIAIKKFKDLNFSEISYNFKIEDLRAGIYFIKLWYADHAIVFKKFIKI